MIVDSHCHLDYPGLAEREAEVVARARPARVGLIVHTRDADADTMVILEGEMGQGAFTGVIHCYSSSRRLAERAVAAGLYLGLGGILTFKRSDEIRATVRDMPLNRLLLETDAPYLAPVPVRGATNEPAFTAHVARTLAEVKGLTVAETERATTDNFFRLFTKAAALRAAA